jgi:hypothetical protein
MMQGHNETRQLFDAGHHNAGCRNNQRHHPGDQVDSRSGDDGTSSGSGGELPLARHWSFASRSTTSNKVGLKILLTLTP